MANLHLFIRAQKKDMRTSIFLLVFFSMILQTGRLFGQNQTENIFIITLDGLRWEEVFGGATDSLMNDLTFVKDTDTSALQQMFAAPTPEERRSRLLPWFWSTLVRDGQLYGNRWLGNEVRCTNSHWFSYPGYNEILTGFSDPAITSNAKKYNENETVLEWFHQMPVYTGKVAAFASWDVFPFIINDVRSKIPVNAGFRKAEDEYLTYKEQILNDLQDEIPSPWGTVRLDAFTHHYMMEYLRKHHPKVVYMSYGETDDFAHDGEYDHYLKSARQTDQWIEELWEYLQTDSFYAGKTTMLITTDHGRGHAPKEAWKSHGKIYEGSPYIWMGVIGPDTPAVGEVRTEGRVLQSQLAKTAARFLGHNYKNERGEVGAVITSMFKQQ